MESKVNQVHTILHIPKQTILPSFLPHAQRFYLESLQPRKDFKKRFHGLTEKWKFGLQEEWKNPDTIKQRLVHVVKEGETLTSISRLYGVSVRSIVAVNQDIVDINLVLEGQQLNIPFYASIAKKGIIWRTPAYCINARDRFLRSLNILGGHGNHKISTMLSSHHFRLAKTKGYILVLVPLLAFCIRCMISAIQHRIGEDLKRRVVKEPNACHHGSRSIRWRAALSDLRELDILDAKSEEDLANPPEDQPAASFEEMSHAYTKIEPAYQKFLQECGMSEAGYWRGGSSE